MRIVDTIPNLPGIDGTLDIGESLLQARALRWVKSYTKFLEDGDNLSVDSRDIGVNPLGSHLVFSFFRRVLRRGHTGEAEPPPVEMRTHLLGCNSRGAAY